MPPVAEQFQAWTHVSIHLTGEETQYWNRVGDPQGSEALAWQQVHNIGIQFWPENAPRRRLFESRCKVEPLIRVPIG